jgi:hypothetical protein
MLPAPSAYGLSAQTPPVSSCPPRPPPGSRAINTTSMSATTISAMQVARSATSESPNSERVHEPTDPGDQRREVDVPERGPLRGGEEVELVPVPPVATEKRHDHSDLDGRCDKPVQDRRPQRREGLGARLGSGRRQDATLRPADSLAP